MAVADVTQTTAASQPLLLAHSGVNYWWGSGVNFNNVSTTTGVLPQANQDIEINVKFSRNSAQDNAGRILISKSNSAVTNVNINFQYFGANQQFRLDFTILGVGSQNLSSTIALTANTIYYVKVTRNATTGQIIFYLSTDGITYSTISSTTGLVGTIDTNTSPYEVGTYAGGSNTFLGKIYRATISNSIGGDYVVDFNPNEYVASTSQTNWNSSTGEVWTINTGTATTGYKGVVVSKTIIQSDGIDDRISTGTLTSLSPWSIYTAYKSLSSSGSFLISDKAIFNETIFATNTSSAFLNSGVTLSGDSLLRMIYGEMNQSNPKASINNAALSTGASPFNLANTGLNLFTSQNLAGFSNALINTVVLVPQADNSTTRTALYNIIRSMSNNAF